MDWDTDEWPQPAPIAPSLRGAPQPAIPSTPIQTNDDVADNRDQRHEAE